VQETPSGAGNADRYSPLLTGGARSDARLAIGLIRVETSRKYQPPVCSTQEISLLLGLNATLNTLDITGHLTTYWFLRPVADNVVRMTERREGFRRCSGGLGTDGVRRPF
jgi:hypothetical protein